MDIYASLDSAARAGDVSTLYNLITQNARILTSINEVPYANTPLHASAEAGRFKFAFEVANMQPSFARKINSAGLYPIHLASTYGHLDIINDLLERDCNLCLLTSRGKKIPLHCAAIEGNVEVMEALLDACPDSIGKLTVEKESALHLAAKNGQLEACKLLFKKLKALDKKELANLNNGNGKTALEVAELSNQTRANFVMEFRKLLAENNAQVNITVSPSKANTYLKFDKSSDSPVEARNVLLVAAVLFIGLTYQGVQFPPGGLWQGDDKVNNHTAGLAILSSRNPPGFHIFLFVDSTGFITSLYLFLLLTCGYPQRVGTLICTTSLFCIYTFTMFSISPSDKIYILLNVISIVVPIVSLFIYHCVKQWCSRRTLSKKVV